MLLVIGSLAVILTFLAAFTIYGEVAGVVGLACFASGAVLLGRSNSPPTTFKVTSPAITSFSPTSGPVGTKVTITGVNLTHARVTVSGTAAKIKGDNAERIVVLVPTGAKSGAITVTTKAGSVTSAQSFTVT